MKFPITLLLLASTLTGFAQTNQSEQKKSDTLTINSQSLPAAVKFGRDVYKLHKATPGQKTFSLELTEPVLSAILQCLELSTGSHVQIEQIKNVLREQIIPQTKEP